VTSINAVYIITPRYLEVLADDGLFPAALAARNDRFGTPHWGLLVVYVLSVAALLSPLPIAELGTLLGFGGAFLVVPVMLAAIHVVRDDDQNVTPPGGLSPRLVAGMAALAIPLNLLLLTLLAANSPTVFAGWLGLLAVGAAVYVVRTRNRTQTPTALQSDTP
jgi:APA family basic amino acid/polyamine antiporter